MAKARQAKRRSIYERITTWGIANPVVGVLVLLAVVVGGIGQAVGGMRDLWGTVMQFMSPEPERAQSSSPPQGLRAQQIEFSTPAVGERVFALVAWENTATENITAVGRTTVYTVGIAEGEQLPIRSETEQSFEQYGEREQQAASVDETPAESPPGARFVTRHWSDPNRPPTQQNIDELRAGRARIYVSGYMKWTVNRVEHGCQFCAWTSDGGFGRLCRSGNRCY